MKKLLTLIFASVSLCLGAAKTVYLDDQSGFYFVVSSDGTASITKENGESSLTRLYSGDLEIPETVSDGTNTYEVTKIGNYGFYYCTELTSIKIPNSVTSIGNYAFGNCKGLIEVIFPEKLTSIGIWAFQLCENLTTLVLPEGLTTIQKGCIYNCAALETLVIPESVTNVETDNLLMCTALSSVYCLSMSAPTFSSNNFRNVKDCIFYVPNNENVIELYYSHIGYLADRNNITVLGYFDYYDYEYENVYYEISETKDGVINIIPVPFQKGDRYLGDILIVSEITIDDQSYEVSIGTDAFNNSDITSITIDGYNVITVDNSVLENLSQECIVYVLEEVYEDYQNSNWGEFLGDRLQTYVKPSSSINKLMTDASIVGYFNLLGQRLNKPEKGINIVQYSDGTSKKVLVK